MKTEEDEAFETIERRQGAGGFHAKQNMAMHKTQDQHICRHYKQWQHCHICDLEAQVEELKAQLAQPAQEPVAHVYLFDDDGRPLIAWDNAKGVQIGDKLYTAPPKRQWIWLSDADIADVIDTTCQYTGSYEEFLIKKAERKIRSMNT